MANSQAAAILSRIDTILKARGISDREASLKATGTAWAVKNLRKGSAPSFETIEGFARFLRVSPAFLAFGVSTEDSPVLAPARPSWPPIASVTVIGQVAAGVWLEVDQEVDTPAYEGVPIPPDPDYKLEDQFAVEVRGTSVNRVAPDGSILGCISVARTRRPPRDGDLVIVEQRRNGGQEIMRTAKRWHDVGAAYELRPDSDDPKWRTPIVIPKDADPDNGARVDVIGVVTWVHAPLTQLDRSRRV